MQVTLAGMKSTAAMQAAGCPELTPELLAATGARYSRNGDGLEAILAQTAGLDPDRAVDSIFDMVDYGHASISDMAPVAMFLDDVSMYLAMRIWKLCPTAGGQETSTRYVKMELERTMASRPEFAGTDLGETVLELGEAYDRVLAAWRRISEVYPERMGLPPELLISDDPKDVRKRERMRRNYAFDRSRYYLPLAGYTNVMLLMPARGWVGLVQQLLSDSLTESRELGRLVVEKLQLVTPRLVRHAVARPVIASMIQEDFEEYLFPVPDGEWVRDEGRDVVADPELPAWLEVHLNNFTPEQVVHAAKYHRERYDGFGEVMAMVQTNFGWPDLPIGEIRDFNRHRTGSKRFTLQPTGVYSGLDQLEGLIGDELVEVEVRTILDAHNVLARAVRRGRKQLADRNPAFVYWLPLGTKCRYQHVTTANHFLYQAQLRTGLGTHYYYARRMRQVLELWHQQFPATREFVRPGTGEPE